MLEVSQNLLEGAGREMKYGVGHLPGSAMPGQKGNCAIAGHRPYPFLYLDQLKSGDSIVIRTDNTYTYTMYEALVVLPTDVWVLGLVKDEPYTLTLITCTPYPVDDHRLIIRARLTSINGKTPQEFYGIPSPSPSASPASPSATPSPTVALTPSPGVTPSPSATAAPTPPPSSSGTPAASGKQSPSGAPSASAGAASPASPSKTVTPPVTASVQASATPNGVG